MIFSVQKEKEFLLAELQEKCINSSMDVIRNSVAEIDNPAFVALTCSPDYLMGLKRDCIACLERTKIIPLDDIAQLIVTSNDVSNRFSTFILHGGATCNTSHDINFSDSKYH